MNGKSRYAFIIFFSFSFLSCSFSHLKNALNNTSKGSSSQSLNASDDPIPSPLLSSSSKEATGADKVDLDMNRQKKTYDKAEDESDHYIPSIEKEEVEEDIPCFDLYDDERGACRFVINFPDAKRLLIKARFAKASKLPRMISWYIVKVEIARMH